MADLWDQRGLHGLGDRSIWRHGLRDSFQPAQISLFVLFVASMEVLVGGGRLRHLKPASYWSVALVGTAALHMVAGVMLIVRELTAPTAWW